MTDPTPRHTWQNRLRRKAELCASALAAARLLVVDGTLGPVGIRLAVRAGEILDEVDEILIGLDPRHDHAPFVRVAALHRELEAVQALTPRALRSASRRDPEGSVAFPDVDVRNSAADASPQR